MGPFGRIPSTSERDPFVGTTSQMLSGPGNNPQVVITLVRKDISLSQLSFANLNAVSILVAGMMVEYITHLQDISLEVYSYMGTVWGNPFEWHVVVTSTCVEHQPPVHQGIMGQIAVVNTHRNSQCFVVVNCAIRNPSEEIEILHIFSINLFK